MKNGRPGSAQTGVAASRAPTGPRLIAADLQTIEVASALAGQGVALGSPILFAAEIAQGRLIRPFETTWDHNQGYWLVYPTDRSRVPKITAFRDWLLNCLAADPATAPFRSNTD